MVLILKDNRYEFKDLYEERYNEKMQKLMTKDGYIKGTIINDNDYKDGVNPYATEFIVNTHIGINKDGVSQYKEVRVNRSNIIRLCTGLE